MKREVLNKMIIQDFKWKYYLQLSESWTASIYKRIDWWNISKNIDLWWIEAIEIQKSLDNYFFDDPLSFIKSIIVEKKSKQISLFDNWLEVEDESEFYELNLEKEEFIEWVLSDIKKIMKDYSITKWRNQFFLSNKNYLKWFNKWLNEKVEIELLTNYHKNFSNELKIEKPNTNWYSSNYMFKLKCSYWEFNFFEKVWKWFQNQEEMLDDINLRLYEISNLLFWILKW